jgi:hypothetical protein
MIGGLLSFKQHSVEARFTRSMFLGFVGTLLPVIIGIGDSRYRMPSMPFYTVVIIFFLSVVWRRIRSIT